MSRIFRNFRIVNYVSLIILFFTLELQAQVDTISQCILRKVISIKPNPRQLNWQKNEFTAFIHFGVNTFTGREWGTGLENPKIFNPDKLNTDQWCEVLRSAGMKMVIITAKHHDGFCLWPTRYTDHSVKSSDWMNGNGDVLKKLSESCQKYGLKLGVYLSPADLYQIENRSGLYGNLSDYTERIIPRPIKGKPFRDKRTFKFKVDDYNEYFLNQLFELLTEYGPIHEVWFDGAHPKRKGGQKYTYSQWYHLIRELAPEAVIFGKGPDVRWCGNEAGNTRSSEWSVIPIGFSKDNWTWPDLMDSDLGSISKIRDALKNSWTLHWYPAETNTSIREGWFWRDEKQKVKSVDEILDIWYRSVGGNSVFLLNIPPNKKGEISNRDIAVLEKVGNTIKETFKVNLAESSMVKASSTRDGNFNPNNIIDGNIATTWIPKDFLNKVDLEISLQNMKTFNRILLQENIGEYSQRISSFEVDAYVNKEWQNIYKGTTVGYKKICKIPTIKTNKIRVRFLGFRVAPTINNFGLYFEKVRLSQPIIERNKEGIVSIYCSPSGPTIKFTIDGSDPNLNSMEFTDPFLFKDGGEIKAIAVNPIDKTKSEVVVKRFDIAKAKWSIHKVSSEQTDNNEDGAKAIDGDEDTNWITRWRPDSPKHPHYISINLGERLKISGFTYTPRKSLINGTIKKYAFYASSDGEKWEKIISGKFDNIKNNPVKQYVRFGYDIETSFIKLEALSEVNGNPWASAGEIGVISR